MTTIDISGLIQKAYKKREPLAAEHRAYRLFNSVCDGINGVTIDIYGAYAAVSWYLESALAMKEKIAGALARTLELSGVYELYRFRSPGCPQNFSLLGGSAAPEFFTIEEDGSKYLCSFAHGQNAGFFIDNRANRRIITETCGGKNVLNLFSYTGVLSVAAAAGGAASVASVDISAAYNKWAKRNLEINGYDAFAETVLSFDAFDYMNFSAKKGRKFDLIIIDPPPFAARLDGRPFGARKDYHRLIEAALKITSKEATILALCNMAGYPRGEFALMLEAALKKSRSGRFKIDEGPKMPPDFKSPPRNEKLDYLKNYYISVY